MLRLREWLNRSQRPNKFTVAMGRLIRQAREERGMSQEQLAEAIYRSRPAVSEMESGKMEPDASTVLMLAFALEKPIPYFFPPPYGPYHAPEANTPLEQELILLFRSLPDESLQRAAIRQMHALAHLDE